MADQYDAGVGERSVSSLCQTQHHGSLGQRCRKEEEQGRIIHWFDVLWCFSLPFCFDLTGQVKGSQTSFGFLERCLLADVLTSRSRTRDEWQDGCTRGPCSVLPEGEIYLEQGEISNICSSAAAAGCECDWRQRSSPGRTWVTSWICVIEAAF